MAKEPRKDCFAWDSGRNRCNGLSGTWCARGTGECKFYKTVRQARMDRIKSMLAREKKGMVLTDSEYDELEEVRARYGVGKEA